MMTLDLFFNLSLFVTGLILAGFYIATLVHIRMGSKYNFLTILTVLMLVSCACGGTMIPYGDW